MGAAVQVTQMTQVDGLAQAQRLEVAKDLAQRAQAAAYGPQPVRQPDGSTKLLCLNGRLHRALMLAADLRRAGDVAKLGQVEAAVQALGEQLRGAQQQAAGAEADYCALCALAGVTPDLPDVTCDCEGCRAQMAVHEAAAAGLAVRDAVWALLGAPVGERPALCGLVERAKDEKARDALWAHLKRIADACAAYEQACAANGDEPAWREVWR